MFAISSFELLDYPVHQSIAPILGSFLVNGSFHFTNRCLHALFVSRHDADSRNLTIERLKRSGGFVELPC
ncbi:hypothetical protein WJ22_10575 [Burkholderia vietnamiensis]|nr:hypothetical protein WJ18_09645 [Burkholderia vietnamiensis]KVF88595.1 hypothetical protein WJ19_08265 [Burkholderia vietnamiensis]KVF88920.1 hypothetical protein WJ20_19415 [Burkholderia vietnamiensis]KVG02239.1 hypothetical protein WJ22_10575 [Burkholderia vietnamiensis]KVS14966.1 hypothetical protein WK29_15880 [Burkholderia vietnamiensis]